MYDTQKAIAAQNNYCDANKLPHFAPDSGRCWHCHRDIYAMIMRSSATGEYASGITVERAGRELITGCPHCNRSYCD